MKIAIIGSGVAGLGSAWLLQDKHDVFVYEKNSYAGGHTNTVNDNGQAVDTGFIVYNSRNYPRLSAMFAALGVRSIESNMSFSASLNDGEFEWATRNLDTIFAQRKQLFSVKHYRMLADIVRFHKQAKSMLEQTMNAELSLDDFILQYRYGSDFRDRYLIPVAASIWSTPPGDIGLYPIASLVRFFENHGLLETSGQQVWRTVANGAKTYVERICDVLGRDHIYLNRPIQSIQRSGDGVSIFHANGQEDYDLVILATHANESLRILGNDASANERQILGNFKFVKNRAVLHSDVELMPRKRKVWSSWNYLSSTHSTSEKVSLTYWMNRLQSISETKQYFVTLNPDIEPDANLVIRDIEYEHPLFDNNTIKAQKELPGIQGVNRTWFCGAWCGYGFHEDGLASAEHVALSLGVPVPWN